MRQRLLPILLALVAVLGFIGYTPPAEATHSIKDGKTAKHENSPSPPVPQSGGICEVAGLVNIDDENGNGGVPPPQNPPELSGKNHNHFKFDEVVINCNLGPVEGTFDVDAAGGTDGMGGNQLAVSGGACDGVPGKDPKCSYNHGEDASVGWSHSDCYATDCDMLPKAPKDVDDIYKGTNTNSGTDCYNCGEIIVSGAAGKSCQLTNLLNPDTETCANFLKFCRGVYDDTAGGTVIPVSYGVEVVVPDHTCSNLAQDPSPENTRASTGGGNVLAWGALQNWSQDKDLVVCFLADLELIPAPNPDNPTPAGKINRAVITGVALTWSVANKAECEGKKNRSPLYGS